LDGELVLSSQRVQRVDQPQGMRQSADLSRTLFGTITASIATILTGQAGVTLDAMQMALVATSCDLVVFITWWNWHGGGGRGAVDATCCCRDQRK
jgi:hypothetical protein